MKTLYAKYIGTISLALAIAAALVGHVFARTPTLTLSPTTYGSVTLTVYGDPNSLVVLDYYSENQLMGAGAVGYTNYTGYLSTQLNVSNYPVIPAGSQVVVMINGQQSNWAQWPWATSTSRFPTLTLSQQSVSLTVGQSQNISVTTPYYSGYTTYYLSGNTSSGVASATLQGNTITIYGQNPGSTAVTVCSSSGTACATIPVYVTSSYNYYPYNNQYSPYYYPYTNTLSISSTHATLHPGSQIALTVYNNYPYGYYGYYPYSYGTTFSASSSNPSVATATITGNTLSIYGQTAGNTTITVCGANNCGTVWVTVIPAYYYQYYQPYQQYMPPSYW